MVEAWAAASGGTIEMISGSSYPSRYFDEENFYSLLLFWLSFSDSSCPAFVGNFVLLGTSSISITDLFPHSLAQVYQSQKGATIAKWICICRFLRLPSLQSVFRYVTTCSMIPHLQAFSTFLTMYIFPYFFFHRAFNNQVWGKRLVVEI